MSLLKLDEPEPAMKRVSEDSMRAAWKRYSQAWTDMGRLAKAINLYTPAEHAVYQRARRDYHTAEMTLREGLRQRGGVWDAGDGTVLALNGENDVKILKQYTRVGPWNDRMRNECSRVLADARRHHGKVKAKRREAVAC